MNTYAIFGIQNGLAKHFQNPDLPIEATKTECNHSTELADRETKHEDIHLSVP